MMNMLDKTHQQGRSMIEMLGVLAIVGILSIGGIAGYSKAMAKYKISKLNDQISMIVANIRTTYSSQPGFSGLDISNAIKYGIVPTDMAKSTDTTAVNAYGGAATLSGTNAGFTITFANIPQDACMSIATTDWGPGLVSLQLVSGSAQTVFPMSLANAATACPGGSSGSVVWTYN